MRCREWFGGGLLVVALACTTAAHACEERLRVAIDIGHDLRDPGAISARGKSEYSFNVRLALETVSALKDAPMMDVFLIEEQGRSIPLQERRARARARNADVMLSIHHDSVQEQFLSTVEHEGKTLRYTELFQGYSLFYSEKNGNPALSRETASALGRALRAASLQPTDHHAMDVDGERRAFVDPENGVYRYDGLAVLKAEMPTVLLEAGVIVNPEEEALLEHPAYRRLLVDAITRGLDEMRCALVTGSSRSASAKQNTDVERPPARVASWHPAVPITPACAGCVGNVCSSKRAGWLNHMAALHHSERGMNAVNATTQRSAESGATTLGVALRRGCRCVPSKTPRANSQAIDL